MAVTVLTDEKSWFIVYAIELVEKLNRLGFTSKLALKREDIQKGSVLFILSYPKILHEDVLILNERNIVVHASDLPAGRGWSPLSWQVLEGRAQIPITLFECRKQVDSGDIYLQRHIQLNGSELVEDLRNLQGKYTQEMCVEFMQQYVSGMVSGKPQEGVATYYERRTPKDSELDINRSIKDQFNLLRIVDNERYPAFFYIGDKKYKISIEEYNET